MEAWERQRDNFWGAPELKTERLDISHLLNGTYIYFLYSGKWLQYVGQTKDVFARVGKHRRTIRFDRVEVLKVSPRRASAVERNCIQTMNPALNIVSHPKQRERAKARVKHGYDSEFQKAAEYVKRIERPLCD